MTFRAIVRDGMININTHGELPDGSIVELVHVERAKDRSPRRSAAVAQPARTPRAAKPSKKIRSKDPLVSLFGIWKNRPEWKGKSPLEIQQELRAKAMGRPIRG